MIPELFIHPFQCLASMIPLTGDKTDIRHATLIKQAERALNGT